MNKKQNPMIQHHNKIQDAVFGFAIGDAMGVPLEFRQRDTFLIQQMIGGGVHNQPKGTWSDDTSMMLATMDSIADCKNINLIDMMDKFVNWQSNGAYACRQNIVFDIGMTTDAALSYYKAHRWEPQIELFCGGTNESDNGNGSLMRILPLAFCNTSVSDVFLVSGLTHNHPISKDACAIYVDFAKKLLKGQSKEDILLDTYSKNSSFHFWRIPDIRTLSRDDILSTGYVVDTLESVLWCFLTTSSYRECVMKAIHLGDDADTIGALSGGLAGIYYGKESIPKEWMNDLYHQDELIRICQKLYQSDMS